jgi:hypothetical protein
MWDELAAHCPTCKGTGRDGLRRCPDCGPFPMCPDCGNALDVGGQEPTCPTCARIAAVDAA